MLRRSNLIVISQGYVIGENELKLLKVKGHSIWDIMNGANADEPAEISIGFRTIPSDATIFGDWEIAKRIIDFIKRNNDSIRSVNNSIIGGMIDGDRLKNPEDLKIFKILLHDVTDADKSEYDCYDEIINSNIDCGDV